jgi:hypothetical protein
VHDNEFYRKAIEKMFYIVDKNMTAVPFKLRPPQRKINDNLGSMDMILKARQEGISSLLLARFAIDWLTVENIRCVVIAHEDKATQRLFDRVHYYLDSLSKTWPGEPPYRMKYNSRREIVNLKNNAVFYIGTAGSKAFGRSETINNLHISELAMWPDQERIMTGLLQAVPKDGRITIESTANGMGDYFYQLWIQSQAGKSGFKNHFLAWFEDPDYIMPVFQPLELTEYEQGIINKYGLSREQVAWRRWKINQMGGDFLDPNSWDKFNQEFPENAEMAFIMSGNPVWSPGIIRHYMSTTQKPKIIGNLRGYNPVGVEPHEKGNLKIWKEPDEFHTYAIGVDVSEGKMISADESKKERDASCAQVFDKNTYEQVAVWWGNIDPDKLGRELDMLGRFYNNALIGVERNAVGITPLIALRDLYYPNLYYRERIGLMTEKITSELGWVTDSISKESIISDATNLLRDKRLILYDEDTIAEMRHFIRDAEGHARAEKSTHDDRVMSFMIALRMLSRAKNTNYSNQIERADDDMLGEQGFMMGGQSFSKDGWPVSPDKMSEQQGEEF